jgi:RNA binding exosome subunit
VGGKIKREFVGKKLNLFLTFSKQIAILGHPSNTEE